MKLIVSRGLNGADDFLLPSGATVGVQTSEGYQDLPAQRLLRRNKAIAPPGRIEACMYLAVTIAA